MKQIENIVLEHYSASPLLWPPRDYAQAPFDQELAFKPRGLWVSVKGQHDWPTWCRDEGFALSRLKVCTRIHLHPHANIRLVSGKRQLIEFDEEYGIDWVIGGWEGRRDALNLRRVDWQRLAKDYDGLIISPYVWELRLGGGEIIDGKWVKSKAARISDWYYPWDCASGCIWNSRAIERFEQTECSGQDEEEESDA